MDANASIWRWSHCSATKGNLLWFNGAGFPPRQAREMAEGVAKAVSSADFYPCLLTTEQNDLRNAPQKNLL